MKMTALKTFRGQPGEGGGKDGTLVRRGRPFTAASSARGEALKKLGLAAEVKPVAAKGGKGAGGKAGADKGADDRAGA